MYQIVNTVISMLLTVVGMYYFAKIILKEKYKVSLANFIMASALTIVMYMILAIFITGTLKSIIILFINCLYYKYIFKIDTYKSLLLVILYMIILIIPDLIVLLSTTEVFGISKELCYNEIAGCILTNLVVYSILLLITYLLRNRLNRVINNKINNKMKLLMLSFATLISILLFFYKLIQEFRFSDNVVIYIIAIIIMLIVLTSLIKQIIYNNKIIEEYDNLLSVMTTFEKEIENQRILKHEIKNEFRIIRAKLSEKQNAKEIIAYIDEILSDKYEISKEKYAKFGYLPPNGIKGLCYFKMQEAENKGVYVDIAISKRVENSTIFDLDTKEERDFGRILGVYLDNAIEASLTSNKKQIGFEAYTNSNKEFKLIISNTYNNNIDEYKLGIEPFSTKGKTRGHGLLLVKQLLDKNERFIAKTEIREDIYIQNIQIKKL